jgi:hypothetical protein
VFVAKEELHKYMTERKNFRVSSSINNKDYKREDYQTRIVVTSKGKPVNDMKIMA